MINLIFLRRGWESTKMRMKTKSLIKFLLLLILTVFITVFWFWIFKKTFWNNWRDQDKIDWHDYQQIERDKQRRGTGEQGVPAYISDNEKFGNYSELLSIYGYDPVLSDKIAVDRAIPDIRLEECKSKKYLKHLPSVSVIIPFHNEHWKTVLRTVVSVINRSPPHLLKEVILVDDFSSKEITQPLYDYLAANLTKTRTIHLPERSGLIRAKLAGAKAATAEVLLFLESHTEANVNWLPPLLEPIAQDYKTCVCPFIDIIDLETFEYISMSEGVRGAFDWGFAYQQLPLFPEDLKHPTEPFKSPIMSGGLFAISSKLFWELGGYDEGLYFWGGEQFELSFKIWLCGGQLVDTSCSRVGHIFRFNPRPEDSDNFEIVMRNYKRVAEVWLDEYAQYLYNRSPVIKTIDPGDISKQKALRDRLQCKPFKWFMETIAFDLPLYYPPIEPDDLAYGEIRNVGSPELCIDGSHYDEDGVIGVATCIKGTNDIAEQNFSLTWHMDLRQRTLCLDVSNDTADVTLQHCRGGKGNQYWKYETDTQRFLHGANPRCLDIDPEEKILFVTKCEKDSKTQKWQLENVNTTMLAFWQNVGVK